MRLPGWLTATSKESHLAAALGISVVMMSLMLWAILWQADVISYQQDVIRWLWTWNVK
jgi:hypothetical protein